jgi:hypothetical protein
MRVINKFLAVVLHLLLVALLLLVPARAQTNGFRPDFVQSNTNDRTRSSGCATTPGVIPFCRNVVAGDLLYACAAWGVTGQTLTITDTQLNTYTMSAQNANHGGGKDAVQQCGYTVAGSSSANTVTFSGITFGVGSVAEFNNISGTLDVAATAGSTTTGASLTTSPTTTVNGDLCLSYGSGWTASSSIYVQPPQQYAAGTGGLVGSTLAYQVVGLAGAQSLTMNMNTLFNGSPSWGVVSQCFKPSAITVATSALPDGAQTSVYLACLDAVGGAGAYTWSALSGLPAWATVDSLTTGCPSGASGRITGTPNANATSTVNLQVTDGTLTATRSLTLTAGAAFAVPTLVQSVAFTTNDTKTFLSSVAQGDLVIVKAWGVQNSGTNNWGMAAAGLTDTLGTTFMRVTPLNQIGGYDTLHDNGAAPAIFVGRTTACGPDIVTYNESSLTSLHDRH